jgi:hypothetical protein
MKVADELDKLREEVNGCHVAAFADISTGLVLSVSALRRPPQEDLDALSARAAEILDGPAAATLDEPPELALDMSAEHTVAFVRSRTEPSEVLCCVGSAVMDVAGLLDAARATLGRMDARE